MTSTRPQLIGRDVERAVLDGFVAALRTGQSRTLVIVGAAGIGKSALLDYLVGQASGCRILRAAGVESEMELTYAALHQLCSQLLDRVDRLPGPQHDALSTALGMSAGTAPDGFLVGLAVLNLLAVCAEGQPLICVIDDEQWLDRASAQALAFVARRVDQESVGVVFAARASRPELAHLPALELRGLGYADSRTLFEGASPGPIDGRVRDQFVAETGGNPLALLELPHLLTPDRLAGGFGIPNAMSGSSDVEAAYRRRIEALPEQTRRLLLLAAAEPTGNGGLLWQAARRAGVDPAAKTPAMEAGLIKIGPRIQFHHPLVRSAAYRSGSVSDRRTAHRILADIIDGASDPDRRAWHRALAASRPDETVAAELERSARRAQARGGLAATAAFLERAVTLTLDPATRARRALSAASAHAGAGGYDSALDLLDIAQAGPLSAADEARIDLIRASVAFSTSRGSDAPQLLLKAAKRLAPIDAELSRSTQLDALSAAMFAGRLAVAGSALDVARTAPPPSVQPPRSGPTDLLLTGFSAHLTLGYGAGFGALRSAVHALNDDVSSQEQLGLLWMGCVAAIHVWDDIRWDELSCRYVREAREYGALSELPLALTSNAFVRLFAGDLPGAAALVDETEALSGALGAHIVRYGALCLAALRGDAASTATLVPAMLRDATRRGEGVGVTVAEHSCALLNNGLGRYHEALDAARRATDYPADLGAANWAIVELIEAAARTGVGDSAADAMGRLTEMARTSGSDWAPGVEARCRALLSGDDSAEAEYVASIDYLKNTRQRVEFARSHLVYGEWLRRERRRADARMHLRTAHDLLSAMGVDGFAARARRELQAAGESVGKPSTTTEFDELTAQEAQIARLASEGLSNPEIGERLFISARTVQYHLRKVFAKLGIGARSQLAQVLPHPPDTGQ